MVKLDTNGWQTEFFAATIANIVALNVVSALLQSTSMGIAGVISLKYTQAGGSISQLPDIFNGRFELGFTSFRFLINFYITMVRFSHIAVLLENFKI